MVFSGDFHTAVSFAPGKVFPELAGYEAGSASHLVWELWTIEKSPVPAK
jgi:hypothetical protein